MVQFYKINKFIYTVQTCNTNLVYFNSLVMQHNFSTLMYDTTIVNQQTRFLS